MHDGEHRAPRRFQPFADERENLLLILQIEVICRLVKQQHARLLCKRLREKHPLRLSTRQRQHRPAAQRRQPRRLQRAFHLRFALAARGEKAALMRIPPHPDDFLHCEGVFHRVRLFQHGDFPRQARGLHPARIPAASEHLARIRRALRDCAHARRFARPVRACKHQPFARLQRERNRFNDRLSAAAHSQVFHFQQAHRALLDL